MYAVQNHSASTYQIPPTYKEDPLLAYLYMSEGILPQSITTADSSLTAIKHDLAQHLIALAYLDTLMTSARSVLDASLLVEGNFSIYEQTLLRCWWLYQKTNQQEWLWQGLEIAEKHRIATLSTDIAHPQLKALVGKVKAKEKEIDNIVKSNSPDYGLIYRLEDERDSLRNRYYAIQDTVALDTTYQGTIKAQGLMPLQDSLGQDQVALKYFYGESVVFAFLISQDTALFSQIGNTAQIDPATDAFLKGIIKPNTTREYVDAAYSLYSLLIPPAFEKAFPPNTQLLIIPDGKLSAMPFEALLTEEQATSITLHYHKFPYFVLSHTVQYLATVSQLLAALTQPAPTANDSAKLNITSFAPVFNDTSKTLWGPGPWNSLAPLDESRNVAEAIQNIFSRAEAPYYLEGHATLDTLKAIANSADILHFYTHAFSNQNSGQEGYIQMAPNTNRAHLLFHNGQVTLSEIMAQTFTRTQVAVLSACETGIGHYSIAEGPITLAYAFQQAGVPQVIYSLWNINEHSTAKLVKAYFKQLNKHNAQANLPLLSLAQRAYLNDKATVGELAQPKLWAGMVSLGFTEKPLPKPMPKKQLPIVIIWLGVLVIMLIPLLFGKYLIKK